MMPPEPEEPVIIELDDPVPRGAGIIGAIVAFAVIAILLAPFLITLHPALQVAEKPPQQMSSAQQMCQPRVDVPDILEPVTHFALPGLTRLCIWLAPTGAPEQSLSPSGRNVIQPGRTIFVHHFVHQSGHLVT
ncbi:MAG TPA: hypothetical protein VNZ55_09500 [Thermomicrobiales bacterium]|nr:hypothetical protein [Thermomicrobiales bacterium]